ncbi:Uncharacterised protein [Vibrio cholerae]|nr:Uncharacterised protein [Vibrio cholerae]
MKRWVCTAMWLISALKGLPLAFKARTSTILSKICLICRVKHGQNVSLSNTVVYSNTFTVANTTPTTQMWLVPYKKRSNPAKSWITVSLLSKSTSAQSPCCVICCV